jgi:hypothetical protein
MGTATTKLVCFLEGGIGNKIVVFGVLLRALQLAFWAFCDAPTWAILWFGKLQVAVCIFGGSANRAIEQFKF